MLERLEGELAGLDLCKKSLADFLDGRRRQFPRYYFTSEADLLDILSNGSVPEKVMVHTSKIYLSTKVLTLSEEERTASNRPIAIGFVAGVGKEYVPFEPAVPLEGKVEIYMQTVLDAMKITLYENLKRSDSAWFPSISQLELRVDGVHAMPRRRDAVDVAVRESTRLVRRVSRRCRSTQVAGGSSLVRMVKRPSRSKSNSASTTTSRTDAFLNVVEL